MKITIGDTELVSTQERKSDGTPMGPEKLSIADQPGVVRRELIGRTRIENEDVLPHSGVVSFGVSRIFPDVPAALAYMSKGLLAEETEGPLMFDDVVVFAKAAVAYRKAANVGCCVNVQYTIEG